jgi:glycosyltransferase involved in cell wall biosynthesis
VLICFVSTVHSARDKRVFEKEAISLAEAGFEVTHLCPGREGTVTEKGVRIVTYEPAEGLARRAVSLAALYRRARALRADCYHCNEVDSWVVGVALKLTTGATLVFDVHETFPHDLAEFHAPPWLRPLTIRAVRTLFRLLAPFTDRLVLAKRSVAADFVGVKTPQVLVQNFVPLRLLRDSPASMRPPREPGTPVTAIHVGLISRVRGWPVLLDALAREAARDVHLKIVGEFNDGSQPDFERRVRELGLSARVAVHPWLPAADAFREVQGSDIGLVLFQPGYRSHIDSLPHKLFDYMLASLAVVVPDFGVEVAGIVREADCGRLVDPTDAEALAAVLGGLARDPGECRRLGANGQQAVLRRYNWDHEATVLLEMYSELRAGRTARSASR